MSAHLIEVSLGAALQPIISDTPTLLRSAAAAAVVTLSNGGKLKIKATHGSVEILQAALPGILPSAIGPSSHRPPAATLDHQAGIATMICAPLRIDPRTFRTLPTLGLTTKVLTRRSAIDAATSAIRAFIAVAAAAANTYATPPPLLQSVAL